MLEAVEKRTVSLRREISVLEQLEQLEHVLLLTNLPKLPLIAKLKFTLALFKRYC